ncbi:MAG: Rne/Rng family ribonuclease [Alphaproteobacteria bacterium]|nr:Rne/Rng family ribonuclease [Alphaproteobacteria bacterium]
MNEKLLIDAKYSDETRIAVLNEFGELKNFESERTNQRPIKGNVYLAKIARIEPSIQAAFIDYGANKHGFLPISEIHHEYFNKEVLSKSEDEEQTKNFNKRYKIQDVINTKQVILVQAEKEERGNKCAFFTTYISLPGKYSILMHKKQGNHVAMSRKLEASEKERIKSIIETIDIPEDMGCIIRTACEKRSKAEIKRDMEFLCRLWDEIKSKAKSSNAPELVYEEGNIIKKSIRDMYSRSIDEVIIQGKDAYKEARSFMKTYTPSHVKKIKLWDNVQEPLFLHFAIEEKISDMLNTTIPLPSGGSIVINHTEALTAIDVNSGKLKDEKNIESTAIKTNLEASEEIVKQIKLRDIAGIIVVDFIDMEEKKSKAKVEKKMSDLLKVDYSSTQIGKISQFGLMEISRQRLRQSLTETNFSVCPYCKGAGKVKSHETIAMGVIRKIEAHLLEKNPKRVVFEVAPDIDLYILNHKKNIIQELENNFQTSIEIARNLKFTDDDCKMIIKEQKHNKDKEKQEKDIELNDQKRLENKTSIKKQKARNKNKKADDSAIKIETKTKEDNRKKYKHKSKHVNTKNNSDESSKNDKDKINDINATNDEKQSQEQTLEKPRRKRYWLRKIFS